MDENSDYLSTLRSLFYQECFRLQMFVHSLSGLQPWNFHSWNFHSRNSCFLAIFFPSIFIHEIFLSWNFRVMEKVFMELSFMKYSIMEFSFMKFSIHAIFIPEIFSRAIFNIGIFLQWGVINSIFQPGFANFCMVLNSRAFCAVPNYREKRGADFRPQK